MKSRELAFLHELALADAPLDGRVIETPSEVIQALVAIDAVASVEGRYTITPHGHALLDEIERNDWLLGPTEVPALVAAIAGPLRGRFPALAQFLEEPAQFEKVVRQLYAAGLSLSRIAWCAKVVVPRERAAIALAFATDPRADVRAALFRAWGGPGEGDGITKEVRFKPQGEAFEWTTDAMFVDLLCLGLNDPVADVRDAAARLAYVAQAGAHVTAELLAILASPEPTPWAAAALGSARDDASLAVLRALLAGDDERFAGAAARALAARPDARAELFAALADERASVRWHAEMTLGFTTTGLRETELVQLELQGFETAVRYYCARHKV